MFVFDQKKTTLHITGNVCEIQSATIYLKCIKAMTTKFNETEQNIATCT